MNRSLTNTKFWLCIFASLTYNFSVAQNITTLVGGRIGDGQIATTIGLGGVGTVKVDSNENIYFLDETSTRLRKVNASTKMVSTIAGGGPRQPANGLLATNADFTFTQSTPYPAFCMDKSLNIYLPQYKTLKIWKIDAATGIMNSVIGTGTRGYSGDGGLAVNAQISIIHSISSDDSNNIYIADSFRIRKISAATGIVTTIAGTGGYGYSGDGGPATQAKISQVVSIVIDKSGNIFLSDMNNYVVRKIDQSTGIITKYAGTGVQGNTGDGGLAINAQLSYKAFMTADVQGNLYLTDNNRVRKITASTGIISAFAGTGSTSVYGESVPAIGCGFNAAWQISAAPSGNIYVGDYSNRTIRKIDVNTNYITTVAGNRLFATSGIGGPLSSVQIFSPASIAIDKSGIVYFPDHANSKIYKLNTVQQQLTSLSAPVSIPQGIAMDTAGNLYYVDADRYIKKISLPSGVVSTIAGTSTNGYGGDGGPASAATLNLASSLAIDTAGNIYIADRFNHRIRKITASTGIITTVAGNGTYGFSGDGGPATSASLNVPSSVAVDRAGNIYIADINNYVIRRVDAATNIITTFAGIPHNPGFSGDNGPANAAQLYWPGQITTDRAGNVYFGDELEYRIRKVNIITGIISTVAGNGSFVFNGDDIPATIASLESPGGLAIDNAGDMIIGDLLRIRKVTSSGLIQGIVFYDYNSNGTKDSGEPFANDIPVNISSPLYNISVTARQGQFKEQVDTGTYITTVKPPQYYSVSPELKTSIFTQPNSVDSIAFALQPVGIINDLSINLTSANTVRLNAYPNYLITYKNAGTTTLNNATIKLVKDSRTSFLSATVTPNIVNDTLSWNVGTLSAQSTGIIGVTLITGLPPVLSIGDFIHHYATIAPIANDSTPSDDTSRLVQTLVGAFDPNEKVESHGGAISPANAAKGEYLNYTIHFQNTGNDTAFVVIIRDTLSSKFDLTSLELISSSHPFDFSIRNGNQLTWLNQNILLPDSNVNAAASQGYVSYRIKLKSNIAAGDSVQNRAGIYFDYNLPVLTAWSTTKIKPLVPVPSQPLVDFISSAYCSTAPQQRIKILNLPVTPGETTARARININALSIGADSVFNIQPQQMPIGNYSVIVEYDNQSGYSRATYPVNIAAPATPDVDVSANNTQITSTSDQVTVTAMNKVAGGNSPIYSFATDRNFTNILQPPGALSTTTITAAQLVDGDNWIYARMQSSDTCVTSSFALDSIKILKSIHVTGITDVDNPTIIINSYPNPMSNKITITGLMPTKNYLITVSDNLGHQVIKRSSRGIQIITISSSTWSVGPYWISIYDKNKNKLIGSIRIVKQ